MSVLFKRALIALIAASVATLSLLALPAAAASPNLEVSLDAGVDESAVYAAPTVLTGTAQTDGNRNLVFVRLVVRNQETGQFLQQDGTLGKRWARIDASLDGYGKDVRWELGASLPPGPYRLSLRAIDAGNDKTSWVRHNIEIQGDEVEGDEPDGEEPANVQLYSAPRELSKSGLESSDLFTVQVGGTATADRSFVYRSSRNFFPSWKGHEDYLQEANHWTTFSSDGPTSVTVTRNDRSSIASCVVRPKSKQVAVKLEGNTCTFTVDGPAQLSVEIDETFVSDEVVPTSGGIVEKLVVKNPLFIFAEPLETVEAADENRTIKRFSPGVHVLPGGKYQIPNDTTVIIEGGAVVVGSFEPASRNPQNIAIRGRGILTGRSITENPDEAGQWINHAIGVLTSGGSGLSVEGITITDPLRGAITSYSPMDVSRVKLLSWGHRNDGITVGAGSTFEDSFIKVQDDSIKLYNSGLVVRNIVVWQQTSGAVLKLSWNQPKNAMGISVSDIDVIHSDAFYDYPGGTGGENDRPDLSSKSAIISSMGYRNGSATTNVTISDLRIEEPHVLRLLGLRMASRHDAKLWGDPDSDTNIAGLRLVNVHLAGEPIKPSFLYGNSEGSISGIHFENLRFGGQRISSDTVSGARWIQTAGKAARPNFS